MTPEELNRTIEFLVQHQAQFSIHLDEFRQRMDQLTVHMDQLTLRMDQLTVHMDQLTVHMDQLTVHMDHITVPMDALAAHQKEASLRQQRDTEWAKGLFSRITELVEVQSHRLALQDRILQENEEAHREARRSEANDARKRHEEVVNRLDRILEKLSDRKN